MLALAVVLAVSMAAGTASAAPWSFGVMSDTQWTVPDDGLNPNSVAVGIINQINAQFIKAGVKFVVQVGDLTDNGSNDALSTRASAAQALYDAGIGFYPHRGNHESSQAAAVQFQTLFPQTQGTGPNVVGATNFSSPDTNLAGLSYSFDYQNARFVLLDQFTRTDGTGSSADALNNHNIADQQTWINTTLAGKPADGHVFVFSHKNLIGQNHVDMLLGSDPSQNPDAQNAFIESLQSNGARYYISGHDHIHQRSLIESPDGASAVQEIIGASDSSKFYIPAIPSNDNKYNNPTRETSIQQERNAIGFYIYTVDGPRVTVDYYSAKAKPTLYEGEYLIYSTPTLKFAKKETFGYSLNGKEFLVPQGGSFTKITDSHGDTTAKILSGKNNNTANDGSRRPLTMAVDTGWSPKTNLTSSYVFSLWGMATRLGFRQTDVYALSMTIGTQVTANKALQAQLASGSFGLATKNSSGRWINAVDTNFGGTKKFVVGPWRAKYTLGTYGFDPSTLTAWAVVNHGGDFAIAWHKDL